MLVFSFLVCFLARDKQTNELQRYEIITKYPGLNYLLNYEIILRITTDKC
jgi:hypothetical protein